MLTRENFSEVELNLIDKIEEIKKDALTFEKNMLSFLDESNMPEYINRILQHINTYASVNLKGLYSFKKNIDFDEFMHWFWEDEEGYRDLDLIGFLDFYGRD